MRLNCFGCWNFFTCYTKVLLMDGKVNKGEREKENYVCAIKNEESPVHHLKVAATHLNL